MQDTPDHRSSDSPMSSTTPHPDPAGQPPSCCGRLMRIEALVPRVTCWLSTEWDLFLPATTRGTSYVIYRSRRFIEPSLTRTGLRHRVHRMHTHVTALRMVSSEPTRRDTVSPWRPIRRQSDTTARRQRTGRTTTLDGKRRNAISSRTTLRISRRVPELLPRRPFPSQRHGHLRRVHLTPITTPEPIIRTNQLLSAAKSGVPSTQEEHPFFAASHK